MSEVKTYHTITTLVTQTPGVCGGKPCIAGRRIRAQDVYIWYDLMGMTVDEIASEYDLSLSQIHAVLAFAYENIEQIRADIRDDDAIAEEFKNRTPSKLKAKLLGE